MLGTRRVPQKAQKERRNLAKKTGIRIVNEAGIVIETEIAIELRRTVTELESEKRKEIGTEIDAIVIEIEIEIEIVTENERGKESGRERNCGTGSGDGIGTGSGIAEEGPRAEAVDTVVSAGVAVVAETKIKIVAAGLRETRSEKKKNKKRKKKRKRRKWTRACGHLLSKTS